MKRRQLHRFVVLGGLLFALSACTLTMATPAATLAPDLAGEPTLAGDTSAFDPAGCVSDNPGPNVVGVSPVLGGDGTCYRLPMETEVAVLAPADMPFMPVMVEFYYLGVGLEPDVIGVDHDATDGIAITWRTPPTPFQGQLYAIVYSDDKGETNVNTLGVYGE
ncbi:MAG: hypothetical protein IT320_03755 [Anaerolineae bacterium]|nr:hypothetical protein [Anaerolineae bacterium]